MAQVINFSSVFIRTAGLALDEGTKKVRINVTASLTKEVRDKMDWQEPTKPKGNGRSIDDAATSLDLDGELHGQTMTLAPNDKEMAKFGFTIDISQVKNFQLVTVQDETSKRKELRFQILTTARGAVGELEKYTDRVGQAKGSLKVSYVQQSEMELSDEDPTATDEQRQAVLED